MDKQDYEARQRRLGADIEDARKTLVNAQRRYEDLCEQRRDLQIRYKGQNTIITG